MEIILTGKYISQFNVCKKEYDSLVEEFPEHKEDIYNLGKGKSNKSNNKLEIIKRLNETNTELAKNIDKLLFFNSINSSYNKNKGEWFQEIFGYVFEKTNKFGKLPSITWKDNIIHNKFILQGIKINNKFLKRFAVLDLENLKCKKLTFHTSKLDLTNKRMYELLENEELYNLTDKLVLTSTSLTASSNYQCEIYFKNILSNKQLFCFLEKFKLLCIANISKLKTDITYLDKKTDKIQILELKMNEFTPLEIDSIYQCIAYGIREKVFNKTKFKEVDLVFYGNLKEGLLENLEIININLYDEHKFKINLIHFGEYLENTKNTHFDDDTKNNYRKSGITCWDFNTLLVQENNGACSDTGKYMKTFSINTDKSLDKIIINADFIYCEPAKKNPENTKNNNEQEKTKKMQFRNMGESFLE